MEKITPFLWYENRAEEAMPFYVSVFKNARIVKIDRIQGGPAKGSVLGTFQLEGQQFHALDGGPYFQFSPGVSFFVSCETRDEMDALWAKLSEGGTVMMPLDAYPFSEQFGWLADRFGVSWHLNLGVRQQKIAPFFLFVGAQCGKAEEAMRFYTSLFDDSAIVSVTHYGPGEEEPEGRVKHGNFKLAGQEFMATESGYNHKFTFTGAISLYVNCRTQDEIDGLWNKLSDGGEIQQCGWVKDRYGIFWQVVPSVLPEMLQDADKVRANRVMDAMLQMKKLDIAGLTRAYQSNSASVVTPAGSHC